MPAWVMRATVLLVRHDQVSVKILGTVCSGQTGQIACRTASNAMLEVLTAGL